MSLNLEFNAWDLVLLGAVSLMGTAIAYLHQPKWKGFVLSLPVPFTVASMSLGSSLNATHVLALLLLLLYTHGVRLFHLHLRLPILPSIALSVGMYVALAVPLAAITPRSDRAFWWSAAALFMLSLWLNLATAHRAEPGHRTPLPVWVKLPIIVAVVLLLIVGKKMLQGFMTLFPMVGLITAYEARHSLWTICRTIPALTVCMIPMLATIHLAQPRTGLPVALVLGWLVYLSLFIPTTLRRWTAEERAGRRVGAGACPTTACPSIGSPAGSADAEARPDQS